MAHEIAKTSWLTDSRLKAYYKFSSGALTTDSSGEGHTLTAISDPAETTGKFDGGVDFDGNDAYSAADHADFKPTGNFTLGLWLKILNNTTTYKLFQSVSQNPNVAGFRFNLLPAGQVSFLSGDNTGATINSDFKLANSTSVVDDDVWHFIVGTWDGSYLDVYVDGVREAHVAWAIAPAYAATNYVRIGCTNAAGTDSQFFPGELDDVFLINGHALSAFEVANLYDSQKTGFF